jgi:phosphomannomutase/phosphoglucomutase
MKMNSSIFREYDIRGIANQDLDAAFAEQLGFAYTQFLKTHSPKNSYRVSVGQDCRLTSPAFADALTRGLKKGGVQVIRLGVCPTPLTYFSIFHLSLDGGIMVTGSHNPGNYNGFKICVGKNTLHGHDIQKLRLIIETNLQKQSLPTELTDSTNQNETEYAIIPAYIDHLVKKTRPLKKLKVVVDAGNGTASTVAPELFQKLGLLITPLFCELDGNFPNHHPDPTVPENLKDLVKTIRSTGADLGVAFDGDSDRIGLADETGRIFYGDEIMILLARSILKENPGATIISEVKSSYRLFNDIQQKGGKPIMWKTGHSLIKSKMKETGALLAGEMSGHIFFSDRNDGYDDALYAAVRVFEILSATEQPLSALIADLEKTVTTPEIRIECEEELKFKLVDTMIEYLPQNNPATTIDGVRMDFGKGWGLARASNTQPVIVFRFEAGTEEELNVIQKTFYTAMDLACKKLGHPPVSFHSSH